MSEINFNYNTDNVTSFFKDKNNITNFFNTLSPILKIINDEAKDIKKECLINNLAPNFKLAPYYSNIVLAIKTIEKDVNQINNVILQSDSLDFLVKIYDSLLKLIKLYDELNEKKIKSNVQIESKVFDKKFNELINLLIKVQKSNHNFFVSKTKKIFDFFMN